MAKPTFGPRARALWTALILALTIISIPRHPVSPLLTHREDVLNLYTGKTLIRPDGYSVELDRGSDAFWQPVITYRLYKIENPIGIVTLATPTSAGRSAVPPSPTP